MSRITLTKKIKREDGVIAKESHQYEIDRITFGNMIKFSKEISAVLKEVKKNNALKELIEGLFGGELDVEEPKEGEDKADKLEKIKMEQLEKMKDDRFVENLAGSLEQLLEVAPERVVTLLSVATDIDRDAIKGAYAEEILDLFDAIIEENDIVKLVNRIKKSFFSTKEKWVSQKAKSK
ncbi:hypothetical protein BpsM61_00058 [Bacillus phage vB_BpsM-61]|nr:hypothetical protein BpsM61_00058 [Bacillus phage vB_BpsM-61]